MYKKIILISSGILIIGALCFTSTTFATGFISRSILRSVNLLGYNLVKNDAMKMTLIHESASSTGQTFQLPSTSGNDGMLYTIKFLKDDGGQNDLTITTTGSDTIDGTPDNIYIYGYGNRDSVTLVADEDAEVWWAINSYMIQ